MEGRKWQVKTIQKQYPLLISDKEKIKSYIINLSNASADCGVRPRICTNQSNSIRAFADGIVCVSAKITIMSKDLSDYQSICQQFEQEHKMTSDEFLLKFETGELDDPQDFFDWFAAKHALDLQQANRAE